MTRFGARLLIALVSAFLAIGVVACGEGLGFSGNVGLELTYTPVPPLSYNIETGLTLGLSVADFTFESETIFDLSGFQSQEFGVSVGIGAVSIADEILFDPYFSWNQLSVDADIVGITVGVDLILAGVAGQTASHSMGTVLELSSGVISGFSITTLTGFGATNLVNLLGGIEAPHSYNLLGLFYNLDGLCAAQTEPKVTIVPNFYFEEELVRLEIDFCGILSSSSTWLDWNGFVKEVFEFGYRFEEPSLAFLTAITIDDSFAITGLDFILDLAIGEVQFTSWTSFAPPTTPSVLPVVFSGQKFAVSFEIFGAWITSETGFDGSFLFERQRLAIVAEIEPVTFASLTVFDALGFSSQCLRAGVTFCGVTLYTTAAFDASGVTEVSVGFELSF